MQHKSTCEEQIIYHCLVERIIHYKTNFRKKWQKTNAITLQSSNLDKSMNNAHIQRQLPICILHAAAKEMCSIRTFISFLFCQLLDAGHQYIIITKKLVEQKSTETVTETTVFGRI